MAAMAPQHKIFAILIALAFTFNAGAQHSFKVNASQCRAATPEELKWLPAEWTPFRIFTRACPVLGPGRRTDLLLISPSAEKFYKSQPGTQANAVKLPAARLYLPGGRFCGTLPYAFPDDPPVEMSVRFSEWRGGSVPTKIDLEISDPTASGNRRTAMVWDPVTRMYQEKNK